MSFGSPCAGYLSAASDSDVTGDSGRARLVDNCKGYADRVQWCSPATCILVTRVFVPERGLYKILKTLKGRWKIGRDHSRQLHRSIDDELTSKMTILSSIAAKSSRKRESTIAVHRRMRWVAAFTCNWIAKNGPIRSGVWTSIRS